MVLVTSLLLNPSAAMAASQESTGCPPQYSATGSHTSRYSTALAPLCTTLPFPTHLPIIDLFTLEFEEPWLEREYQCWKAECMKPLDAFSLLACFLFIVVGLPCGALNQACLAGCIIALATAAVGLTRLMPRALYLYGEYRDQILTVTMLCMVSIVNAFGNPVWRTYRVFTLMSLFLPVRLRWFAPRLVLASAWGAAHLAFKASSGGQIASELLCLFVGGVLAPSVLLYIMEVISRRMFVSRQAILAAEDLDFDDDDDDWWLDEDEEEFDDYN